MGKLRKFTLIHNDDKGSWDLTSDETGKVKKRFDRKEDATAGGALSDALGQQGGSVKIQKQNGEYQEERTFPRSKDPKESKG